MMSPQSVAFLEQEVPGRRFLAAHPFSTRRFHNSPLRQICRREVRIVNNFGDGLTL